MTICTIIVTLCACQCDVIICAIYMCIHIKRVTRWHIEYNYKTPSAATQTTYIPRYTKAKTML